MAQRLLGLLAMNGKLPLTMDSMRGVNDMQPAPTLLASLLAVSLALSTSVLADRDRRDDRHGVQRVSEYKEEFRDGPCLVKRELKRDGSWKEQRECRGRLAGPHAHPRGDYKEKYTDGPCKVEREWKRGEFKEKIECRTYAKGPRGKEKYRVVIAQPPWIVYEPTGPSYRPGWEPPAVPRVPAERTIQCNRELIGGVLGGVIGGALGSQIGQGSGRTVATIGGAIAGVLIGGAIGRDMDAQDQACIGRALELGQTGQRVSWQAGSGGARYAVTPGEIVQRDDGRYCRDYDTEIDVGGRRETLRGVACRGDDGVWSPAQ